MGRFTEVAALALVALVFCHAGPALAQSDAEKKIAKKHHELGQEFYKISNYPKALSEFEAAYKLYPLPSLLFNIARCHEVMANLEQALEYYRRFLKRLPTTPRRSLVEARIKTLQERLDAKKSKTPRPPSRPVKPVVTAPQPPPVTAPPPAPVTKPTPLSETPGPREDSPATTWGWKRTAGWTAVGVGGATLVTGIILGAMAAGKASEYEETRDTAPFEDLEALQRDGGDLETAQIALLVAGGVVAAAGVGLLVWDHFDRKRSSSRGTLKGAFVAPYASAHGAGLVGRVDF